MHPGFGARTLPDEICAAAHLQPRMVSEATRRNTTAGLVSAGLRVGRWPINGSNCVCGPSMLPVADANPYRDVGAPLSYRSRRISERLLVRRTAMQRGAPLALRPTQFIR